MPDGDGLKKHTVVPFDESQSPTSDVVFTVDNDGRDVRVLRGRAPTPEADRKIAMEQFDAAVASGESVVRVWIPPRQLAFGRRDANEEGYEAAKAAAHSMGFPPMERSVGGRAVAYDGKTTLAFAAVEPDPHERLAIDDRYRNAVSIVREALESIGAEVQSGEPTASFCPGDHSLQNGGKLAGIAQRVTQDRTMVSGVIIVANAPVLRNVLTAVYDRLGVPFEPTSLGSVTQANGPEDPERVSEAIETAFVGDRDPSIECLDR